MYRIIVESNQILSMHSKGYKRLVDILAIVSTLAVIITGFVLHKEVHHIYVYNDVITWRLHEVVGILLMLLIAVHGVQHSPWFKNYMKIPGNRKEGKHNLPCRSCYYAYNRYCAYGGESVGNIVAYPLCGRYIICAYCYRSCG